jgi:hypothetical protein
MRASLPAPERLPGRARVTVSSGLWNNVALRLFFVLLFICSSVCSAFDAGHGPPLLLSTKRLHRLKLDAQRQTERWSNFEQRVKTVTGSPERGFELALYGTVTGNGDACRSAVEWGKAHAAEHRQIALILNWCGPEIAAADRSLLLSAPVEKDGAHPFASARDALFMDAAEGRASRESIRRQWSQLLPLIQHDPRVCLPEIYSLFEFIDVAQKNFRLDLRQDDARLFAALPNLFLLAMHPADLEHPDWKVRAGGLMMVNVDPNLQGSSFIQGWAMEDPKMARDGPGVAYEFLWANPYLPGLGYYNMDLFSYDVGSSLLLARKSWDANSCWVSIFREHVDSLQCPPGLLDSAATFGALTLVPMKEECLQVTPRATKVTMLSGLQPGAGIAWEEQGKKFNASADASGNVMLSSTASGRVCRANMKR